MILIYVISFEKLTLLHVAQESQSVSENFIYP